MTSEPKGEHYEKKKPKQRVNRTYFHTHLWPLIDLEPATNRLLITIRYCLKQAADYWMRIIQKETGSHLGENNTEGSKKLGLS